MISASPRRASLALFIAWSLAAPGFADVPAGWNVAGSAPKDYEFARDGSTAASGRFSARIAAKGGAPSNGFGTLMQTIAADSYRGSRVRLSGYLKTQGAGRAQMWMRVDGADKNVLSFDNMDSRPVTGTTDWTRYDIVLDVPAESIGIAFGFFLTQGGKVWGDKFGIEKVDASIPLTSPATKLPIRPKEPVNSDFEN
jgi:hypothetical protein